MRIMGKATLASAGAVMVLLAACTESATSPTSGTPGRLGATFAVGDTPGLTPAATPGVVVVCKTGNVGGSFAIARQAVGASTGTSVASPANIPTGTCLEVVNDFGGPDIGSNVQITEAPAANTVQTITACRFKGAVNPEGDCTYVNGGNLFVNSFHGFVITYNNQFTPATGCTFTKGWYRNHGLGTVTAQDGRTLAETKTILQATPGKPLGVTFGGDNLLLNLYQQYLTALLNLGGAVGPTDVMNALTSVANGTDGSGLAITTTLSQTEISDLTATLDSFNEGTFTGWPHCP
jgi:hypothetical protein